jgi:hypothetical protein
MGLGNIQGKSMRPNQNNKRMRGRNNNNRKGPNPLSRTYESNGPDVKIRGTAHHIGEKYLQLARDAQSSGDPVMAESYLQHAEHYFRIIAAAQQAQQQAQFGSYNRPGAEAETEELEEEDDFNGLSDRFASPAERSAPAQQQPQPYAAQPQQGQAPQPNYNGPSNYQERPQNYQERPQYEPRERNNRNFQDRNNYNDRNAGHREGGNRDNNNGRGRYQGRSDAPRYDNGGQRYERHEARNVPEEAESTALPAFITAPVPVRAQVETERPAEEDAGGTNVMARPETEDEAGYGVRQRRRRRKPEFEGDANKTPYED